MIDWFTRRWGSFGEFAAAWLLYVIVPVGCAAIAWWWVS